MRTLLLFLALVCTSFRTPPLTWPDGTWYAKQAWVLIETQQTRTLEGNYRLVFHTIAGSPFLILSNGKTETVFYPTTCLNRFEYGRGVMLVYSLKGEGGASGVMLQLKYEGTRLVSVGIGDVHNVAVMPMIGVAAASTPVPPPVP